MATTIEAGCTTTGSLGAVYEVMTTLEIAMAIAQSLQMCGEKVEARSLREIAGVLYGLLGRAHDDVNKLRQGFEPLS